MQKKNNSDLSSFFEKYWAERYEYFPLDATQQNVKGYDHLLANDQTKKYRDDLKAFYGRYLQELKTFDRKSLNENDQISYDIFEYELKNQIESIDLPLWQIPFQQFWGLPQTFAQLGSGEYFHPFKTVEDYDNWLKRVDAFADWTDSALENFRMGLKNNYVLPKSLIVKMLPQVKDLIVKDPKKSLFWGPINKFPDSFSSKDKERLTKAFDLAIRGKVNPSYEKMYVFLKKSYLAKGRKTSGISALGDGVKTYEFLAQTWTTTTKSPEDIYQTGLKEVARIRQEMEKVKQEVGFKGTLPEFFHYIKTDKKFTPYSSAKEILDAFENIHVRMKPQLQTMFGRVPKTPFMIKQTEEFRAASASAEYSQGSPDGSRPGVFYLPILDPKTFNITSGMESLFLHEAIPGHHYQISLQQENQDLPKFRQFSWYGAYGEGWALYTESLGFELGLYKDPYQYVGALSDEMHRALRLVVDVGLHLKGMTREEAIKYLLDNEPISLEGATAEIERYMAIPGQALSYKTGSLKIRELREKYQKMLGDKFKISEFHDEFLKDGCMPLALIEKKMDKWAQDKK